MEKMQFTIINKEGKQIVCEVIATYHDDETNKDYIVYTDGSVNEEKQLSLYYSLYKKEEDSIKLIDIETMEDKKIGLQIIEELIKDINK